MNNLSVKVDMFTSDTSVRAPMRGLTHKLNRMINRDMDVEAYSNSR